MVTPALAALAKSKPRLKILVMSPFAPRLDAVHGGGRVVAHLVLQLAARHSVALLCIRGAGEPAVDDVLRESCDLVEEVPADRTVGDRWTNRLSTWLSLLRGKPLWAIDRATERYRSTLQAVCRTWQPDIIQIEFHMMGQYLAGLKDCPAPRVLTQHEPGLQTAREVLRSDHRRGRLMPYLDLFAWQRFERGIMRQVQAVVVFTKRDRDTLLPLAPNTPIIQIPFGITAPEVSAGSNGSAPLSVLFVGNFQHLPNVDAALRLTDDIFPCIRARFPESQLYIVGNQPPPELQERANPHVVVTGYVPDITPYLDKATVVAIPLRLGGGMRVKVVEALAAGKVLVASPLAVEGLDLVDGEQVVLAETDEAFSEAIATLFDTPEQRAALAGRARSWACLNLSWERFGAAYEMLYRRLLMSPVRPLHTMKSVANITVAISTRERPDDLASCVDALLAGDVLPAEVVVVDQSHDGRSRQVVEARDACKQRGVRLIYIHHDGRGLAASQNVAISKASCPIIAVTDDDCVPAPEWIATIERAFASPVGVDVLTGRVLPLGPPMPGQFAVSSRVSTVPREFDRKAMPWEIGSGNNFVAKRTWLKRVGGNDERLGPGSHGQGGVDMDLFYRLLRAGSRIRYEPALLVYHARTTMAGRLSRRIPYGYGMGVCCTLWLRQGDRNALRVLAHWVGMRLRRFVSAPLYRHWLLPFEELLVLSGTVRGLVHGLRIKNGSS